MHRPRLRRNVDVYLEGTESIHFLFASSALQKTFEADPLLVELIKMLDGHHETAEILSELQTSKPTLTIEEVQAVISALAEDQLVEDAAIKPDPSAIDSRYVRQLDFWSDFDVQGRSETAQSRLRDARVVVIGLGGTGSWVAQHLTMSGVGRLVLCDFDRVEVSNLTRQAIFSSVDVGCLKIDAAKERLSYLNPDVIIETHDLQLDEKTELGPIIKEADIVINCTDSPSTTETGLWVARACMPRRIPHIIGGGYHGHLGFIGPTIVPFESACWECISHSLQAEYRNWVPIRPRGHSGRVGSLGALSSIVAAIHAWEAVRVITNILPPRMTNCTGELHFDTLEAMFTEHQPDPDCRMCGLQGAES